MNYEYDKEYMILSQIDANPAATQRDISRHTGLSLGSVNLLLKKMAKEGLVKIESIPAHRVVYMLTPKGIVEKANKTVNYIRRHYNAINQTKETMKDILADLLSEYPAIYLLATNDEVGCLAVAAVEELDPSIARAIILINTLEEACDRERPIVHCAPNEKTKRHGYTNPTINLLEKF